MKLLTYPTSNKKRAIIKVLFFIIIPIGVFIDLFIFLYKIPVIFFRFVQHDYNSFISILPQGARREIKVFDVHGLRHNLDYLNNGQVRISVALTDLAEQSEYADKPTVESIDKSILTVNQWMSQLNENISFSNLNTTSIGNIAYLALHHTDESIKEIATDRLYQIEEYFKAFQ